MADRSPFFKYAECRKLAGSQFLIVPKEVALGTVFFRDQTIDQSDGFHRFAVVNRANVDAGLLFELLQNWLRINLVLRGVNDHLSLEFLFRFVEAWKSQSYKHCYDCDNW